MQTIEKALKTVFDFIGNNYKLPQGEFLNDEFSKIDKFRNPYWAQVPKKVKFGFGTKKELNIWLKNTTEKYPLVWLVYPLKETFTNDASDVYSYLNCQLIFAIDNQIDKLVETRVQTTRFILDQLTNAFSDLMRVSKFRKYLYIDKDKNVEQIFHPNYSTNQQKDNGSIDIWDAITYDCTLHFIPNCFK